MSNPPTWNSNPSMSVQLWMHLSSFSLPPNSWPTFTIKRVWWTDSKHLWNRFPLFSHKWSPISPVCTDFLFFCFFCQFLWFLFGFVGVVVFWKIRGLSLVGLEPVDRWCRDMVPLNCSMTIKAWKYYGRVSSLR